MQFLNCGHQNYDWGKPSSTSVIYQMQSANPYFSSSLDPTLKYAELWIGTHKNLPSYLKRSPKTTLSEYLQENPNFLSKFPTDSIKKGELPFLMKILCVNQSLSIQAHPDKDFAAVLHKLQPEIYKDANHKPEMAIALSKFEALCNFAPAKIVQENLYEYEEFRNVFPEEILKEFSSSPSKETLKILVETLFNSAENFWKPLLEKMIKRLQKKEILSKKDAVLLRLHEQFPLDIGIFFTLFMNYIVVNPGDFLIMRPNEPHAYLSGDCIECMANSDNVVRAGLTPKLKDVQTLFKMLSYKMGEPEILSPIKTKTQIKDGYDCDIYRTDFKEFHCIALNIGKMVKTEVFCSSFPFVGIILEGNGALCLGGDKVLMKEPEQFFIPSNQEFYFENSEEKYFKVYLCGSW